MASRSLNFQLTCRCCQTNANQSKFAAETANLSGTKLTPLAKSGGACQLEGVPAGERSFLVEVVVDGGVNSGEFLRTSHTVLSDQFEPVSVYP